MYFPWPGFFEHMSLADAFIWLDDAQFSKGSYTNRIQVKLEDGRKWMSIPLYGKGTMTRICDLQPGKPNWAASHREMLRQSFRKSPHGAKALEIFDASLGHETLVDDLISSCEVPGRMLGALPGRVYRSSQSNTQGQSWRRVLDMVKTVGGTRYLTGHGAAHYLDHMAFELEGVSVEYMDYSLTPWPQEHGAFTPYVTILDAVAAQGDNAKSVLRPRTVPWREFLARHGAG
jgi:hypothetical protein